jgi:rRNA small subunit pseudouridine methyltransferase Nep1
MSNRVRHTIIFEEASLELVPARYTGHKACKLVEARFGVPPRLQILDDNYHHDIIVKLENGEKRGRPDVVHLALLDVTSTPAFVKNLVTPVLHTVNGETIEIKQGVRLPRTLQRFSGVMSKILSGQQSEQERQFFDFDPTKTSFKELARSLRLSCVICLSTEGEQKSLKETVIQSQLGQKENIGWVIGGFPRGHFSEDVKSEAKEILSISELSLPAHVVSARLSYEIELANSL